MNRRNTEFGKFIQDRRKSLGISQQKLAELLKVHPTYLSKIEQKGFIPSSPKIRMLALCLQANPADLIELSGTETAGGRIWRNSSELSGLTRDESVFIQNLRLLSAEGKRFMENSLRYVLAGENKAFQVIDDKSHSGTTEIERYKEKSEITKNQISTLAKTNLELPIGDVTATKQNRAKPDERFEAAKKEFLAGHTTAATEKFNELLADDRSEETRRKIANFLFRNNATKEAKRVLSSVPMLAPRSKILMAKMIAKDTSAEEAARFLENKAAEDSANAPIYRLYIAEIWLEGNSPEKSKEVLTSVNPTEIKTPIENMKGSMIAAAVGMWGLAEQFGEQAAQYKESEKGGLRFLCSIFLAQGKEEKLASAAMALKEKYSTDPMGHLFESISLHMQSKIEESLISLERAMALKLTYNPLIDNLIDFLIRDGVSPTRLLPILEKFMPEGTDKFIVVYADALKEIGEQGRALEILKDGKKRYPKSQRIAFEIAANLFVEEKVEDAEAELRPFEQSDKATASTLLLMARIKQELGNLLAAKEFAERAIVESAEWLPPFIALAEIYSALGKDAKALTLLEEQKQKFRTKKDLDQILVAEADLYTDRKLYEQAIPILEKLTSEDPKEIRYKIKLGFAYVRSGMYEEGAIQFLAARDIDPNHFQPSNNLAYALNMSRDYKGALEILENLKKRSDFSKDELGIVHSNLAHSLVKLGRVDEAEAAARRAIQLDPTWAESYFNLGLCLMKKDDVAAAKDSLQKAISLDREGIILPAVQKLLRKFSH